MAQLVTLGETMAAFAPDRMGPQDLPEEMFRDCHILHLSGITPVLSDSCESTT